MAITSIFDVDSRNASGPRSNSSGMRVAFEGSGPETSRAVGCRCCASGLIQSLDENIMV